MYVIPKIIDQTFHNSYFLCINFFCYINIKDTSIILEYFLNNKHNLRASNSFFKFKAIVSYSAFSPQCNYEAVY